MQPKIKPILTFVLLIVCLSCSEDVPDMLELQPLVPLSQDDTAGNWRNVLGVDYLSQLDLPVPENTDSEAYQLELEHLSQITKERTRAQEERINYWAAGGVIRWNQVLRALVSKYNVAPSVGATPDPQRPFTNPPFAARAYALLSVAQHDALIAAWQLKYDINRPSPSLLSTEVYSFFDTTELPSYPSEQSVIASVSAFVLKRLFPAEADFLDKLAEEHTNTVFWGGTGTESDVVTGMTLGTFVASKVMDYAANDRMNLSADPNATYISFFEIDATNVPEPWKCIELPLRKPMLPLYGRVKTWMDSTSVFLALPPPPPIVGSVAFNEDIANVRRISDNRSREQWRISDFWADGGGTSTPPGHWNLIAEELILSKKWSEVRTARAFSLMNRAIMDSGILCWYAKYKYYFPRPSQIDPNIRVSTGIPNFPSYTSGHSAFSSAAGTLLGHLFPSEKDNLEKQFIEAGNSRVYGGIHYQFDNLEGRKSGIAVGEMVISNALNDGAGD
ncbi:MAG: phosphatase PAP2 family protein [Aquaticitalea sp.]